MKLWTKMTNEELVLHLELWLAMDGTLLTDFQREFFKEVCWRLVMTETIFKEDEK